MEIFKALMSSRVYGWTSASVYALNIDVVFADDKQVRVQWKAYYDKLCVRNPTEKDLKKIETEKCKPGFSYGMKSIWMSNVVRTVWNSFKAGLLKCFI